MFGLTGETNMKNINYKSLNEYLRGILSGDCAQPPSLEGEEDGHAELVQGMECLKERLFDAEKKLRFQTELLENCNNLMTGLNKKGGVWILVVDAETREIVYCNKGLFHETFDSELCTYCDSRLEFREQILDWNEGEHYRVRELEDGEQKICRVTSFPIIWDQRKAFAHLVVDISLEKDHVKKLAIKAYHDLGTGIYNRRYFEETMERLLKERQQFVLVYMDLDGLKFVNDNYGHLEGDAYIRSFVEVVQKSFRTTDIFARIGGDEFGLILENYPVAMGTEKMEEIISSYIKNNEKPYPASFSYGIIEVNVDEAGESPSIETVLSEADKVMYAYKRMHKRARLV